LLDVLSLEFFNVSDGSRGSSDDKLWVKLRMLFLPSDFATDFATPTFDPTHHRFANELSPLPGHEHVLFLMPYTSKQLGTIYGHFSSNSGASRERHFFSIAVILVLTRLY
jgi:hypothetical protein